MCKLYARDTSRKIKSVSKAKGMSGKHLTGTVIYGYLWDEKREYLGHTINFKARKHFRDKKSHYVDENEWTIFENTHDAIIDQETFDNVQRIRGNSRRYPDGWGEAAPLTGLRYCAGCGGKMYVHRTNNGERISQYTCGQYSKTPVGVLCPTRHRINESAALDLISGMLQAISDFAKSDRAAFIREVQEAQAGQKDSDIRKKRRRLAAAQKRAGELERLACKIYEDNASGRLPDMPLWTRGTPRSRRPLPPRLPS